MTTLERTGRLAEDAEPAAVTTAKRRRKRPHGRPALWCAILRHLTQNAPRRPWSGVLVDHGVLVDDEGRGITLHARVVVCHPTCARQFALAGCVRESQCSRRQRVVVTAPFVPVAAEQEAERDAENVEDPFIRECADEEGAHGMLDRTAPHPRRNETPCSRQSRLRHLPLTLMLCQAPKELCRPRPSRPRTDEMECLAEGRRQIRYSRRKGGQFGLCLLLLLSRSLHEHLQSDCDCVPLRSRPRPPRPPTLILGCASSTLPPQGRRRAWICQRRR